MASYGNGRGRVRVRVRRGIAIEYEADGTGNANGTDGRAGRLVVREAPPSALPDIHPNAGTCERCYKNRECMMYAAADRTLSNANAAAGHRHGKLLDHFTGHLTGFGVGVRTYVI